ncbi:recombination mediator RecR [Simkania negevensis]|uniref:Recombination protein RecR n=1 Tax=Simkania negevensis (strain ATCC VR-1471 / DSM 27360 / Z) TaxID=331113 RepID=F8L7G2_SIMNZ|nr:recombination mediator RecR [Simkania negevensis]CCB88695.1 recombination protein recR [Simkania negevensis Z]
MAKYPKHLLSLIAQLQKLPGVGKKTAERFAFDLLEWERHDLATLANLLSTLKEKIPHCNQCGCLMEEVSCSFCESSKRDPSMMCIIASPRDAFAIEETGNFLGLYHALGTLLSPLDGQTPEKLNVPKLLKRIELCGVQEVILALDSTLEGDATALFLKEELHQNQIKVSRLALGLPVGSSLDFIDEGTLSQALSGRQVLH